MEIIWFFGVISSIVLSFIIANAGTKRQIGFGWSLFLGLWLTPIVSLIAVLLSDKLLPDEYSRLEKKWGCLAPLVVSLLIVGTMAYIIHSYSNKDKQQARSSIEFRTPEFLNNKTSPIKPEIAVEPVRQRVSEIKEETVPIVVHSANSVYEPSAKKGTSPVIEIKVDLNDFLGTPDDGTDWNYTELSEDCYKALASKGVYYSENIGAWVMEKSRKEKEDVITAEKRRQEAEKQYTKQAVCRATYNLNGRQAKSIPMVENVNFQTGIVCLKIEVSPNGDVVSCEIDRGTSIDDSRIWELCISTAKNIKFNAINSKMNQAGTIRYNFTK